MKTLIPIFLAVSAVLVIHHAVAQSETYEVQRWSVHDPDRPQPPRVEPGQAGAAPSDAVVLFDGTDLSAWQHPGGGEPKWRIVDRALEIVPGTPNLQTKRSFGDAQVHVEWMTDPSQADKTGQNRGNSGILLMGLYEIQVLETRENQTYPDGMGAALYGQYPPEANAGLGIGRWQTYDIIFHRPRFRADGSLESPATLTALHNGVLVQDNVELQGPAVYQKRATYVAHGDSLPLMLQNHGGGVRFRNIWIRPLASSQTSSPQATTKPSASPAPAASAPAETDWQPLFSEKNDPADYQLLHGNEAGPQPNLKASDLFEIKGNEVRVLSKWDRAAAPFALLYTRRSYSNYDLELEYQWGRRKFKPRDKAKRDAGVLFHIEKTDVFWPDCLECQIQEGDSGDLWAVRTACVPLRADGVAQPFDQPQNEYNRQPRWANHETPGWNKIRAEVRGSSAVYYVNGERVNAMTQITRRNGQPLTAGKVGIQAEGSEVTYRNIRIREITPMTAR